MNTAARMPAAAYAYVLDLVAYLLTLVSSWIRPFSAAAMKA